MTELERLYYCAERHDLPLGFLRSRRAAVHRLMRQVAKEMSGRMDILEQQKRSHEEHLEMIRRYRDQAALRNAEGMDHVHEFHKLVSDLKHEYRMLDLQAWRDTSPLRHELRELMREDMKLMEKERILGYEEV